MPLLPLLRSAVPMVQLNCTARSDPMQVTVGRARRLRLRCTPLHLLLPGPLPLGLVEQLTLPQQ